MQDSRFGNQLEKVLEEAKAAGVQRFACNGCCEADWEQVSLLFKSLLHQSTKIAYWDVIARSAAFLGRSCRSRSNTKRLCPTLACTPGEAAFFATTYECYASLSSPTLHLG